MGMVLSESFDLYLQYLPSHTWMAYSLLPKYLGKSLPKYHGIRKKVSDYMYENNTLSLESPYVALFFFIIPHRGQIFTCLSCPPLLEHILSENRDFVHCYKFFAPRRVGTLKKILHLYFRVISLLKEKSKKVYYQLYMK